jgi:glycosyltransferase involved in cell wall biosynthesis
MNILLITNEGYNGTGSTYSIAALATGLANRGHIVVVGCRAGSLLYQLVAEENKAIPVAMNFHSKISPKNIREIRDTVLKYNIQIINAQSTIDRYTTFFAKLFFNLNVLIVHTRRQTPRSDGGALQRWFYTRITEKIIVVGNELKNIMVQKGYPEKHIQVIRNGIDTKVFQHYNNHVVDELRKKHGLAYSDKVLGCVSRLKKQEQIIKALKYLDPEIKIIFLGIKPGTLDTIIASEGIKNQVIYAGTVDKKTLMNYYRLFDLVILASVTEGFTLTLVESMGSGVPVVGTRAAGIIDVLDNEKFGLWFEDGNINQLVEKIKQVLYDENTRKRLIHNGLEAASKGYTLDKTLDQYEEFFAYLLERETAPEMATSMD